LNSPDELSESSRNAGKAWKIAYWVCFACWVVGAVLGMWRIRAGLLSSYLSDVAFPPWFYILIRGLAHDRPRAVKFVRWFGRTPARAALSIFAVGVGSEFAQLLGIIEGTFDPWDMVAYGLGLGLCYVLERSRLGRNHSSSNV